MSWNQINESTAYAAAYTMFRSTHLFSWCGGLSSDSDTLKNSQLYKLPISITTNYYLRIPIFQRLLRFYFGTNARIAGDTINIILT